MRNRHATIAAVLLVATLLVACGTPQPTATLPLPSASPTARDITPEPPTRTPRPPAAPPTAEPLAPTAEPPTPTAGPLPTGPTLEAPLGEPPDIDGVLSPGEWQGARREELAGGGELWLLQDGEYLYLGIRAKEFGAGSICVDRGDRIEVLHASAALGTATYTLAQGAWQRTRSFEWCCRSTGNSASARDTRAAHLESEGWLANISGMGAPEEMEYQIALQDGPLRLAVTYMEFHDSDQALVWWPAGIGEGCRNPALIRGPLPESLSFAPETWAMVTPAAAAGVEITILYDNYTADPRLGADWGFAALVEVGGHTLLFDTGSDGALLLRNMEALEVDLASIEAVVLSHAHADHTAGLPALLDQGIAPPVYVLAAFPASLKDSFRQRTALVEVTDPVEIVPGVYSTGHVSGPVVEQALVVETGEGLVVITGCAHPGAVEMVRRAMELPLQREGVAAGEIALVLGGFHMGDYGQSRIERAIAQFRELGVRQVSPTHCTGEEAIAAFAQAYGDDYVPGGVGRVIVVGIAPSGEGTNPAPAADWPTSAPEEQGVDSARLADMLAEVVEQGYAIDSILVARNGVLVLEAYRHPYGPETRHILYSCTKSVVSALVGIAIEDGALEGVSQPVLDLFPERAVQNIDARKRAMTLEHLLTMTSGLRCRDSYLYRWEGLREMQQSADWVQHVLDLPMAQQPGTHFEYCNGVSYLLSAIVQAATSQSAHAFATARLFGPLGIQDVEWPASPQGISIGWSELRMRPRDMAKLGQLYLQRGQWQGQQVVPAEWVAASTRKHADGTLQAGYGYQWWLRDDGVVMALGYAGQYIVIVPDRALVAVFTSDLPEEEFYLPQRLLDGYILPAAAAAGALPPNPPAVERLQSAARAWAGEE